MKLSIIIAAYNVEKYIEKCVKSCYDENLQDNYEIIVVNDGSLDGTVKILESLIREVKNLKIISKENEGLGAARNTGIANANGTYIWMIDGDDFLTDEFIPILIQHIKEEVIDVFKLNYNITSENGEILSVKYSNEQKTWHTGSIYYEEHSSDSYTWQHVFKKSLFDENQLKFKDRINMQDSEIMPKIMYFTEKVKYLGLVGYNYRQQQTSFTNSQNPEKRLKYFESIISGKRALENFSIDVQTKESVLYGARLEQIKS